MADSDSSISSDRNSYITESFTEDELSDIEETAQPYQFEQILRRNVSKIALIDGLNCQRNKCLKWKSDEATRIGT
ncbi:hypothetical protein DPMN_040391 [Dreissena polymorpha]|uniref:Uncharacterized protein n=1 Tax=Dreissena polymorpha TaxID=45954 RepID=A0A9D4CV74_DREPO|nr:hypothetical protein DPMN_040391 [Dreissena polymorpha]